MLQGAVDHGLEFVRVFYFAALGEDDACFFCIEPGGIAAVFFRVAGLANFHQKSFYHIFLHTAGLPEHSLGVNVNVKMAGLDDADGSRFFSGFAFCGPAMREARLGGSLGKCPLVAAIGMNQQKLDVRIYPPVADGSHLQGQRKTRNPGQAHLA